MKEKIIAEIRRIAEAQGTETLSRSVFKTKSQISEWQIYKHFNSWNDAVKAAGLKITKVGKIDSTSLWEEMLKVFSEYGIINRLQFNKHCKYSVDVYRKRFGNWNSVLSSFRCWLIEEERIFKDINQLPIRAKFKGLESKGKNKDENPIIWSPINKNKYGEIINFRGLQHAPVNEQGVVFLFGMTAFELGFFVEVVQSGFPDCEAKRRVANNRYERVKIEFEYKSSNFKDHGHKLNGCDIIVCWEHNWSECPIEVLELKSVILTLEN